MESPPGQCSSRVQLRTGGSSDVIEAIGTTQLRPEDVVALHQLVGPYAHHVDEGEGVAFAALFSEDAVLELGPTTILDGGRSEIAAFADALPNRIPGIRHLIGAPFVQAEDDGARGRAYFETFRRPEAD